jgi:hypothetical protein
LSRNDTILPATKGVCFFGTPHGDLTMESWTNAMKLQDTLLASQPMKILRKIGDPSQSLLFNFDEATIDISRQFRHIIKRHQILIQTFYETRKTPTSYGNIIVCRFSGHVISIVGVLFCF